MRRPGFTRLGAGFCALFLALLPLAGCATSSTTPQQATATLLPVPPTATPLALAAHTQDVGGARVADVIPGTHGLLIIPPSTSPLGSASNPSSGRSFPTSLSFYNLGAGKLQPVVTAPVAADGSQWVITYCAYAGDWVSYEVADAQQAYQTLWIYNVVSGERLAIAGSDAPAGSPVAPYEFWAISSTDVVWQAMVGTAGSLTSTLEDYTFATGHTRGVYTNTLVNIGLGALNATSVLFFQDDPNDSGSSTWLLSLDQGQPVRIANDSGISDGMNSQYAVWANPHTGATSLYNLKTGALSPNFANCLRPALDDTGPYMVCRNFHANTMLLIKVPDGAQVTYSITGQSLTDDMTFFNGRAYFVGSDGSVVYVDFPVH